MKVVRLESERLIVREWRADEIEAMHRWLGNPEVTRFLTWGSRMNRAEWTAWKAAHCSKTKENFT